MKVTVSCSLNIFLSSLNACCCSYPVIFFSNYFFINLSFHYLSYPPHFSPNAIRADFNLSRPSEANSCVKEEIDYQQRHKWACSVTINEMKWKKYEVLNFFYLPRRKSRQVEMSSCMCERTTCLFLQSNAANEEEENKNRKKRSDEVKSLKPKPPAHVNTLSGELTGQPGKVPFSHFFSKSVSTLPYSSLWSSRGFTLSV